MLTVLDAVRSNWLLLAVILGLTMAFVLLRTRPTTGIDSLPRLDVTLTAGQPVVLEFYSNF